MRSESLLAAALVVGAAADLLRAEASRLAGAAARVGPPALGWMSVGVGAGVGGGALGDGSVWVAWVRLEGRVVALVGPGGLWGEAFLLDALALDLRAAARVYAEVEAGVAAVLAGVASGSDLAEWWRLARRRVGGAGRPARRADPARAADRALVLARRPRRRG